MSHLGKRFDGSLMLPRPRDGVDAVLARILQAITEGDVAAADLSLTEFLESDVAMQQCAREVHALFGGLGG